MIMKAKTWIKIYVFTFYSNFHIYIIKFWKPYINIPHQDYNQKKITKGTGIAIFIVRILRKQDETLIVSINLVRCKSLIWGISYLKFINVNYYYINYVFYKSLI